MTSRCLTAFLCLAAIVGGTTAAARADEQLVYRPLITDGTEYRRVSYPQEAGAILALAGTEIVVEARRAPVSYWPITREYIADLALASAPVEGTIEIVDPSGATIEVETEPYVLSHPAGVGAGPAELIRGDAAQSSYAAYVREARAAAEAINEYQRIVARHRAMMESWLSLAADRRGKDMPPPPPELDLEAPKPYHAFVSEPEDAAILSLPEGRYTIRIRNAEGEIVPGSERPLVSFAPSAVGTGYVIRPEDRWTQPSVSFAPHDVIYTSGEADLFLQPIPVAEFRAGFFARLFRPQSVHAGDPTATIWVPREGETIEAAETSLALIDDGETINSIPARGFRVSQIAGRSRGYTIEPFEPKPQASLTPDFTAMRVESGSTAERISLSEGAAGTVLPASERRIRTVTPPDTHLVFLPALLPLALGVALRAAGARRTRRRRP